MEHIIWYLEDDPAQQGSTRMTLERKFRGIKVRQFSTEYEFREAVEQLDGLIPSLVISDVMVPWADPCEAIPDPPPDVQNGTSKRAGVRCHSYFRAKPLLIEVPWIYFTVLDANAIGFQWQETTPTEYVHKGNTLTPLVLAVGKLLR